MKKGLVLEGGAMRGLFTAGILDVMMEHGVWPDGLIGVSAGAAFGCNMKSRQAGRAVRYNKRFARDPRYSGLRSLLTTGDYFNADFGYHVIPREYDLFDDEAFEANPMEFVCVCTDVETGQPVYKRLMTAGDTTYDGGVSDSIPLEWAEQNGYERNVVILTQPAGYQKRRSRLMPLMRIGLRKYPQMVEAMNRRYLMYNRQLEYVAEAERQGRCLVIRPDDKLDIGHVCHNPEQMERIYQTGREMGERRINEIKEYL